ncbi:unnamed protein product [Ambrosiozyma monospora]|uniref:Unnamed protein product n=1 Tax=Ambrosiozyma monospora TaxID=43982 RepID=A0ACB5T0H7_AMBMO|nr:unnamed protein product [Ambrosiozyma monospora]
MQVATANPQTLDAAVEIALNAEATFFSTRSRGGQSTYFHYAGAGTGTGNGPNNAAYPTANDLRNPDTMDIDEFQGRQFSQRNSGRGRGQVKCFGCKGYGHKIAECPTAKKQKGHPKANGQH